MPNTRRIISKRDTFLAIPSLDEYESRGENSTRRCPNFNCTSVRNFIFTREIHIYSKDECRKARYGLLDASATNILVARDCTLRPLRVILQIVSRTILFRNYWKSLATMRRLFFLKLSAKSISPFSSVLRFASPLSSR